MAERELISKIRDQFNHPDSQLFAGIGDDCALFGNNAGNPWMITTDMLVENVHFNLQWHDPYRLGRKAVAANISDIAAMGGVPKFILQSLSLPPAINATWIDTFIHGVADMCKEYDCTVIGGDTVSGKELSISVTVLGTSKNVLPVKRSGAMVGDLVYVSGCLGSAALGLELFKSDSLPDTLTVFHDAHLDPVPQVKLGRKLAEKKLVSAMQDLSDGIATDLAHICHESGVGAVLVEQLLPMEDGFLRYCDQLRLDPSTLQLQGGEDYHLVFTVPKDKVMSLNALQNEGFTFYEVGRIQQDRGVCILGREGAVKDISYQGYEHR